MIIAEQFKCEIPTPDALKEGVLYCSTRPTNGWEIAGFLVDIAVALGTIAAVVVAVVMALRASREAQRLEQARRDDSFDNEWKALAARIAESLGDIAVSFPTVSKKQMFDFWALRDQYAAFAGLGDTRVTESMSKVDTALNKAIRYWGRGDTGRGQAYSFGEPIQARVNNLTKKLQSKTIEWRSALLHWHYASADRGPLEYGLNKIATELQSAVALSVADLGLDSAPNNHG